jgi:TonB family protein
VRYGSRKPTTFATMPVHPSRTYAFIAALLLFGIAPVRSQRSTEKVVGDSTALWRAQAGEREQLGQFKEADALLGKAYLRSMDVELLKDRARVREAMGDSAGCCVDLRACMRLGEEWRRRYVDRCLRKDTLDFAASGLAAARFPGIVRVRRTRFVADGDVTLDLLDAYDTVRVGLAVNNGDTLFTACERMAEFPGGESAMFAFLRKSQHYPEMAMDMGVQGKVYLQFTIGTDGRISDARVKKGVHPLLDDDALKLIGDMPAWSPAVHLGTPVRARMILPLNYVLR